MPPIPPGLRLFASDASTAYRARRLLFVLGYAAIALGLLLPWPGVFGPRPALLGLPFALVWVIVMLLCGFGLLVFLFATELDEPDEPPVDREPRDREPRDRER